MANIGNISAIKLPNGDTYNFIDKVSNFGVTSVQVQATSPVQSSVSTASSTTLNTTISLADGYGDTKNPYASKTKNYVLAAPSTANGAPSFRALVAADIPSLSWNKITSDKPTTLAGYGITDAYTKTNTYTKDEVDNLIDALPEPMIFKGSVGTGGTTTALPTAAAANEGWTYKVITALSNPAAKVGDTVISNGSSWIVIPSGDEPSGTVTSVAVTNGGGLVVSGSPITASGTITVSHADTSSQASSSNSGRTYIQSITLDDYGHVTGISTASESVTNTWRAIQVNGSDILGTGTSTSKLNLKAGTNISLSNSSGTVTIGATDTNTHRPIKVNGTEVLGDNTTALDLIGGANITLTNNSGAITIDATDTGTTITLKRW